MLALPAKHVLPGVARGKLGKTLRDTQERSRTGTEPRSPSQPQFQQSLKQLTLQTPASEVLLTGLASSRVASQPSKHAPVCITLRQGISISTSSYFYRDAMREEAQEMRKANAWSSQKPVGSRRHSKWACPPRSGRHACEWRATMANTAPTPSETIAAAFRLLNRLRAAWS